MGRLMKEETKMERELSFMLTEKFTKGTSNQAKNMAMDANYTLTAPTTKDSSFTVASKAKANSNGKTGKSTTGNGRTT